MKDNILLFISDQQRADFMPGRLPGFVHLPNLAWLADRGVVFDRAYCTAPQCTPARGSILTGEMPSRTGIVANYDAGGPFYEFDREAETVGHHFERAGFDTAYGGKWHLPTGSRRPGFGTVCGRLTRHDIDGPQDDDVARQARSWGLEPSASHGSYLRAPGNDGPGFHGRSTRLPLNAAPSTQMAQRAADWLRRPARRGKPFLLAFSCIEPHPLGLRYDTAPAPFDRMYDPGCFPLPATARENPPPGLLEGQGPGGLKPVGAFSDPGIREKIAGYAGAVSFVDFLLGILLEALAANRLLERTLVVFTSDHGEMLARHGLLKKGSVLFEDLVRVPLLVAHPGGSVRPGTSRRIVSQVDLLPTFLDFSGLPVPGQLPGKSFRPLLSGSPSPVRRDAVIEYHFLDKGRVPAPRRALVEEKWKLVAGPAGPLALYDLAGDPLEKTNLVDREPSVTARLEKALARRLRRAGDPWPGSPSGRLSRVKGGTACT